MKKVMIRITGSQNRSDWFFNHVNEQFDCTYDVAEGKWRVLQSSSLNPNEVYFIPVENAFVVKKERIRKPNLIGSFKSKK